MSSDDSRPLLADQVLPPPTPVPADLPPRWAEIAALEIAPETARPDELIEYVEANDVAPAPLRTRSFLARQALLIWYRVVARYRHGSFLHRVLHVIAYLTLPVTAAVSLGFSLKTLGALAFLVIVQGHKAWAEWSPKHLQMVERNYLFRKLTLARLIDVMHPHAQFTARELDRFREDALDLITMYVRDYRFDIGGKKIFANLLIEEGDDIVVLARNERHRRPGARYPRKSLLSTRVFETGEPLVVGDVQAENPFGAEGKPYCSILALPVRFEGRIAGVLSIDSELRYHFDDVSEVLMDYLAPYVAVLAWTMAPPYLKERSKGSEC